MGITIRAKRGEGGGEGGLGIVSVLSSASFVNQEPSAIGVPIKISFGSAISNDYFDMDANGKITCKKAGNYLIKREVSFGRNGSSGISHILGRMLLNGNQIGTSSYAEIDDQNVTIPSGGFGVLPLSVGDFFEFEVIRDNGNNSGGLFAYIPNTTGWTPSSSAQIAVYLVE